MKPFKLLVLQSSLIMSIMTLILGPKSCEMKFPKPYIKLENKRGCATLEKCS